MNRTIYKHARKFKSNEDTLHNLSLNSNGHLSGCFILHNRVNLT
uniref:Uncharacterized protein n=1 Tax=Ciona intestinalis TaxID=7719 RepID=H2Y1E4_CIOIN